MTEEGSVEQISAHVRSLVAHKKAPASLRANLVTMGRLLSAEAVQETETGEKALAGVPLIVDEDVPDREVQVLDADGEVVRTLKIPAG